MGHLSLPEVASNTMARGILRPTRVNPLAGNALHFIWAAENATRRCVSFDFANKKSRSVPLTGTLIRHSKKPPGSLGRRGASISIAPWNSSKPMPTRPLAETGCIGHGHPLNKVNLNTSHGTALERRLTSIVTSISGVIF